MTANGLRALLRKGLVPANINRLWRDSALWYHEEPNTLRFCIRWIIEDLATAWDDPQGVPTAKVKAFSALVPSLLACLDLDPSADPEATLSRLDQLVREYQECCDKAAKADRTS